MGSIARATQYQMTYFIRGTVLYNQAGASTGVVIGHMPSGARLLRSTIIVETAQNAGTTNTASLGTIPETNGVLSTAPAAQSNIAAAVAAGTQARFDNPVPIAATIAATDLALVASLAQTGTAATAGVVTFVVEYVPNL